MRTINIENRSYSFDDIQTGNFYETDHYFVHALHFCQSWLKGQHSFELQTSGSTGMPKDIQVDRSHMEISAKATKDFFHLQDNPTLLCCLNTWFIAGKMMLVRGLEWDATIYLIKPSSHPFESQAIHLPYDLVAMVPLQVENCLNDKLGILGLKKIKQLIIGGAPSSTSLIEKLLDNQIRAYQTYGMTETVSHIALAPIESSDLTYETLPGVTIGIDERNCLWIQAPMAKENRIQTNDIVEFRSPTQFRWLGRADFIINSGGIKVQPELIEKAIEERIHETFGGIAYLIGGLPDESLGQKVVLVLEKIDSVVIEKDFLKSLATILPNYHQPKEIHYLSSFIRTDSGKINRIKTLNLICSNSSTS